MRKHIFLLFTASALLLSACGSNSGTSTEDAGYSSELSQQYSYYQNSVDKLRSTMGIGSKEADNIFLVLADCGIDDELTVDDVKNGTGDAVVGKCAYIYLTEKQFEEMTAEDLQQFAEKRVKDAEYNWVSICCTNGKGICFSGSDTSFATYGELDEDGSIKSEIGTWTRNKDGSYSYSE